MPPDDGQSSEVPADKVKVIPASESDNDKGDQSKVGTGDIYADIAANITQYTNRPDLLLEVVEKYDPGFIKEHNRVAKEFSDRTRNDRFLFGKTQAYVGLGVSVFAAIVVLIGLGYLVYFGNAGFWNVVGLGVFYAITQGGRKGFIKIIQACGKVISRVKGKTLEQ